jgi:hypothetical protein
LRDAERKPRLQGRRWTQHIGWPAGEAIYRRAEILQLALAITA